MGIYLLHALSIQNSQFCPKSVARAKPKGHLFPIIKPPNPGKTIIRIKQERRPSGTVHKVRIPMHILLLIQPRQDFLQERDRLVLVPITRAKLRDPDGLLELLPELLDVILEGLRVGRAAVPVNGDEVDRARRAGRHELRHPVHSHPRRHAVGDCGSSEVHFLLQRLDPLAVGCCGRAGGYAGGAAARAAQVWFVESEDGVCVVGSSSFGDVGCPDAGEFLVVAPEHRDEGKRFVVSVWREVAPVGVGSPVVCPCDS